MAKKSHVTISSMLIHRSHLRHFHNRPSQPSSRVELFDDCQGTSQIWILTVSGTHLACDMQIAAAEAELSSNFEGKVHGRRISSSTVDMILCIQADHGSARSHSKKSAILLEPPKSQSSRDVGRCYCFHWFERHLSPPFCPTANRTVVHPKVNNT
jgi:hypothetical protein